MLFIICICKSQHPLHTHFIYVSYDLVFARCFAGPHCHAIIFIFINPCWHDLSPAFKMIWWHAKVTIHLIASAIIWCFCPCSCCLFAGHILCIHDIIALSFYVLCWYEPTIHRSTYSARSIIHHSYYFIVFYAVFPSLIYC